MNEKNERRKNPRVSIVLKVEYSSAKDFLADYTCNLSESGLFIATDRKFEVGELVHFTISFPGLLAPINCKARIRHIRQNNLFSEEQLNGVGVDFIFDNPEQDRIIRELIQKLSEDEDGTSEREKPNSPFRALIAEDNPLVLEMLHYALKRFHSSQKTSIPSLEVIEVENGHRAWEEISKSKVDIAIVDYFMPVMNGAQLISRIREDPNLATTPIVAVSVGGKEAREASYAAGADLYLDKPLMLALLIESLQRLLRGRL